MKNLFFTKKYLIAIALMLPALSMTGQQTGNKKEKPVTLKHWMSKEEAKRWETYPRQTKATDPPPAPVTNIAEFNRMQSVLIAYPFGISYQLIAAMSEDCNVTTTVASESEKTYVINQYQNHGVNLDHCDFLIAPTNTYWTRDYGPWFVFDGNDEFGIVDFEYNRPRPQDNAIPSKVADFLGINLWAMDVVATGGNYMNNGMGIASSSDLIWQENPGLTHSQIDDIFDEYLGIETYHVVPDPNNTYIDHIDCWGKFLDVDKVMIRSVPVTHPQYDEIEATAAYYAQQVSSYGKPFQVFRVYTPNNEPYTNSLILNKRVFVPITNSQWDDEAIASYEEAMPGYEVLGFTGSWESTDALHCRTHGIADLGMLHIRHIALTGEQPVQNDYPVEAVVKTFSGQSLYSDSVLVYYRINGAEWTMIHMVNSSGQTWTATLPGADEGSQIDYYIYAADESGRHETHPFIGVPDPHTFFVGEQAFAHISVDPASLSVTAGAGQTTQTSFDITNTGMLELNFTVETNTAVYEGLDYSVPDSPSQTGYNYNTYTENQWTDMEVDDSGEVSGFEITFTWNTDSYPEEGSLHVESPSGTESVLASGIPDGTYTMTSDAFNGEEMNGTWKIWIEDTYGDGGHQATNIAVTITRIASEIPWLGPVEPSSGTVPVGETLSCNVPCSAQELTPGTYEGTIIVNSNDPDMPTVEIPVTFVVTAMADVTVTPDTIWFLTTDDMLNGKIINVNNQTDADILINQITETGNDIQWAFDPELPVLPYNLEAGQELDLNVIIPIPVDGIMVNMIYEDLDIVTEVGSHTVVVAWDSDLIIGMNEEMRQKTAVYPNPFANRLTIDLSGTTGQVKAELLDVRGRVLAVLFDGVAVQGMTIERNIADLTTQPLKNGICFIRISSAENTKMIKVIRMD